MKETNKIRYNSLKETLETLESQIKDTKEIIILFKKYGDPTTAEKILKTIEKHYEKTLNIIRLEKLEDL